VGVPAASTVLFVGNVSGTDPANANIIITSYTLNTLPTIPTPVPAFTVTLVVNAALALSTKANVDLALKPGAGGNIVSQGSYIPLVSGVDSIGTAGRRFKDIWLGGSSIYMLDDTLGTDQQITARDGNLNVVGGSGFTVGEWILRDNVIGIKNSARDAYIGTPNATGNLIINRPFQVRDITGNVTFEVSRVGLTSIISPVTLGLTKAAFSIVGTASGNAQPRNFGNTMIQVTGNDNYPTRISFDAFGISGGQNAYSSVAARAARGTVDSPSTTLAGDTILRFTGQGYTGNGVYAGSLIRLNLEAAETFTNRSSTGTRLTIQTTPVGSNTIQTTAAFYANGINLYGTPATTGVTFADGTFQNTAFGYGNVVRKITTGVGFASPGSYQGNVTLDTIDVHSLISNSYTLLAQNPGGNQNITLQLTQ
jgi:hypothetical protein